MENNKELKQAKEEMDKIKQDEHEQYLAYLRDKHIRDTKSIKRYGFEQGMKEGMAEGIKEGLEKGKKEEKKEIIINLHKMQMKIEDIAKVTNLSKEEVEKIIKENNTK